MLLFPRWILSADKLGTIDADSLADLRSLVENTALRLLLDKATGGARNAARLRPRQ